MQKRTLEEAKYPRLANWINQNNLSLAKFGELIELSEKQVWSILRGKARPSIKVVDKICKVTGLTYIHDGKFGDFVNQESFIQSKRNVRLNVGDVILWCRREYGVVVATEYGGGSTIRVMWCDGNTNDVDVSECKKTGQSFVGVSDSLSYIDWLNTMLDK